MAPVYGRVQLDPTILAVAVVDDAAIGGVVEPT